MCPSSLSCHGHCPCLQSAVSLSLAAYRLQLGMGGKLSQPNHHNATWDSCSPEDSGRFWSHAWLSFGSVSYTEREWWLGPDCWTAWQAAAPGFAHAPHNAVHDQPLPDLFESLDTLLNQWQPDLASRILL